VQHPDAILIAPTDTAPRAAQPVTPMIWNVPPFFTTVQQDRQTSTIQLIERGYRIARGDHDQRQWQKLQNLLDGVHCRLTGRLVHHALLHPLSGAGQDREGAERAEEVVWPIEPKPEKELVNEFCNSA
jgi:hypothetical protein